jgi:hypothetical protein
MAKPTAKNNDTTANLGFEAKLWAAADALRNNMDAAEYKKTATSTAPPASSGCRRKHAGST